MSMARSMSAINTILQRGQRKAVDPTRIGVLQLAVERDRMRPSDMAKELQVSASSITRQAKSLQQDGKITITGDESDRRGYFISLTDAGRAELAEVQDRGVAYLADELAEWDPEMVHILSLLMAKLVDTLTGNHLLRQQERERAADRLTA